MRTLILCALFLADLALFCTVMLLQSHCPLQEERLRRGDDLRLQMALEESRRDTVKVPKKKEVSAPPERSVLETIPPR